MLDPNNFRQSSQAGIDDHEELLSTPQISWTGASTLYRGLQFLEIYYLSTEDIELVYFKHHRQVQKKS